MNFFDSAERFRPWWKVTSIVYLVAALALVGYWAVTQSGLVRMLIQLQAGKDGEYYPTITFLVTFLLVLVPLIVLRFALGKYVRYPLDEHG